MSVLIASLSHGREHGLQCKTRNGYENVGNGFYILIVLCLLQIACNQTSSSSRLLAFRFKPLFLALFL